MKIQLLENQDFKDEKLIYGLCLNSLEAALVYTLAKIEVGKTFKRTFLSYFDHTCQTPFAMTLIKSAKLFTNLSYKLKCPLKPKIIITHCAKMSLTVLQ